MTRTRVLPELGLVRCEELYTGREARYREFRGRLPFVVHREVTEGACTNASPSIRCFVILRSVHFTAAFV